MKLHLSVFSFPIIVFVTFFICPRKMLGNNVETGVVRKKSPVRLSLQMHLKIDSFAVFRDGIGQQGQFLPFARVHGAIPLS